MKQLFIGSEGTLGIITAATLKLLPATAQRVVIWAGVRSLADARTLLVYCQDIAGDGMEAFEVLAQSSLDAVVNYSPSARRPLQGRHAWHALIEVVADAADAEMLRDSCEVMMTDALDRGLCEDAVLSSNETQAEALWLVRETVPAAERARGPAVQHDIAVPVERMPAFVEETAPKIEAEWPGTEAVAFGHLGDGNVHYHIIAPHVRDATTWREREGKAITQRVHDLVMQWGGTISAEHGIGQLKRDEFLRLGDPAVLSLLRAVKRGLDPKALLNPGKLV